MRERKTRHSRTALLPILKQLNAARKDSVHLAYGAIVPGFALRCSVPILGGEMQPIISFDGRMARVQFIVQVIAAKVAFVLSIVGIVFLYELLLKLPLEAIAELISTLLLIVLAVALTVLWFIVTFSALYRRLHDIDVRGGWGLAMLAGLAVPVIYAICFLVLAIVPGTPGKNRYDV